MGIMIVPTIASLSEDAMSAVPRSLREGAYALASTKMQVATRVVVPAAISGIVAADRAGHLPRHRRDDDRHDRRRPDLRRASTSTRSHGDGDDDRLHRQRRVRATSRSDSLDYDDLFAVGSLLFVFTFVLNAFSIRLVRRFREVYE